MNCAAFENRIHSLLDERESLIADSLLDQHAASCEECAHMLELYGDLEVGLDQLRVPVDVPDLAAGIVSPLSIQSSDFGVPRGRWLLAFAAALFAALIPTSLYFFGGNDTNSPAALANVDLIPSSVEVDKSSPGSNYSNSTQIHPVFDEELSRGFILTINQIPGQIDSRLDELEPYYRYAQLPVIFPVASSLNFTVDWIRWSLEQPDQSKTKPDLSIYGRDLRSTC